MVAMSMSSTILLWLLSGLAFAAAVLHPLMGAVVLASLASVPRVDVIPAPGYHVALIGAMLLGVVLRLPIERPRLRAPSPQVVVFAAFLVYVAAQFVGGLAFSSSTGRDRELTSLFNELMTGVLAFIVATIVLRGRSPYPVMAALLISALVTAIAAIAQSIGAAESLGALVPETEITDRMTGTFGDPNYYGAYLAAATTLALACVVLAQARWVKAATIAVASFTTVAIALSQSRGAIVALAAGLTTIAFMRSRRAGLITASLIVMGAVVAYPLFSDWRFAGRADLASAGVAAQLDSSGRANTWLLGLEQFFNEPLAGIGFGRLVEETGIKAHNWYIMLLAESGAIGFVLWALFVVAVFFALRGVSRSARTVGYAVLVVWLVGSLFIEVPSYFQPSALVLMALAAALTADWATDHRAPILTATTTRSGSRAVQVRGA
jgi:O-antigen ligase